MKSEARNFDTLNEALIFRLFDGELESNEHCAELIIEKMEFKLAPPLHETSWTTEDFKLLKSMGIAWDEKLPN